MSKDALLPGLPAEIILQAYEAAPGGEISSGKFMNPQSSSALVANAFGFFLNRPQDLPPFRDVSMTSPSVVALEAVVRFPWSGGRHPCLDALITTQTALIGVESKRYEPFRPKQKPDLSAAYWRPVWGESMGGYERVRDGMRDGSLHFQHLDAAQLVKHAFGLRTEISRVTQVAPLKAVLAYVFAEPSRWPGGAAISPARHERHRREISQFAEQVEGSEVRFVSCSYRDLLSNWAEVGNSDVAAHARALMGRFDI